MSWKFGAATSDIIATSGGVAGGVASSNLFLAGWFFPTTLTAGRILFAETTGAGGTHLQVAATTSSLEFVLDRATTDAVYTIAAGIVVNVWQFIAIAVSIDASSVAVIHCWVATVDQPPTLVPIVSSVTTAGSGAATGSNSRGIGNIPTAATVAFQGNIGQIYHIIASAVAPPQGLSIATAGTITADDDLNIFNNLVTPLYNGVLPLGGLASPPTVNYQVDFFDLGCQPPTDTRWAYTSLVASSTPIALAPTGATWTEERPPKEWQISDLKAAKMRH